MADVQRAHELKAQGLKTQTIAEQMGLGRSTVSNYLNNPATGDLYRKRKRQFAMCPRCGGRMSYGASECMRCRRG